MTTEPKPDWSAITAEAKDAIIGPLWADGKSATEIMAHFVGASRNAIIGRITRDKMRGGKQPRSTVRAKAPGNSKRMLDPANLDRPINPRPTRIVSTSAFVTIADPDPPTSSVMDMINGERRPLAGTTPIDILSLPNRAGVLCRFPVTGEGGKMMYCGASCGEQVYCLTHYRIAYRPTETKIKVPKEARL